MSKFAIPGQAPENREYWEAAKDGRLLVKRCTRCGRTHYYPRQVCPFCHSSETEWIQGSGRGVIYSFTVLRRARPPVVKAYVTLEEGVTMFTTLVDCDADALAIDQPVRVVFREIPDGRYIPMFTPDDGVPAA